MGRSETRARRFGRAITQVKPTYATEDDSEPELVPSRKRTRLRRDGVGISKVVSQPRSIKAASRTMASGEKVTKRRLETQQRTMRDISPSGRVREVIDTHQVEESLCAEQWRCLTDTEIIARFPSPREAEQAYRAELTASFRESPLVKEDVQNYMATRLCADPAWVELLCSTVAKVDDVVVNDLYDAANVRHPDPRSLTSPDAYTASRQAFRYWANKTHLAEMEAAERFVANAINPVTPSPKSIAPKAVPLLTPTPAAGPALSAAGPTLSAAGPTLSAIIDETARFRKEPRPFAELRAFVQGCTGRTAVCAPADLVQFAIDNCHSRAEMQKLHARLAGIIASLKTFAIGGKAEEAQTRLKTRLHEQLERLSKWLGY